MPPGLEEDVAEGSRGTMSLSREVGRQLLQETATASSLACPVLGSGGRLAAAPWSGVGMRDSARGGFLDVARSCCSSFSSSSSLSCSSICQRIIKLRIQCEEEEELQRL